MKTIRACSLAGIGALAILATTSLPANAATSGDTITTFTITGGALNITAPANKDLGTGVPGTTITAPLGSVTVTDGRAVLAGNWTATAATTAFTTGGASTQETIAKGTVSYMSGAATSNTGIGVMLPGQVATGAALSTGVTAFSASATVGSNSATWNPTIAVAVPNQAVAGAYTGTITHSVS